MPFDVVRVIFPLPVPFFHSWPPTIIRRSLTAGHPHAIVGIVFSLVQWMMVSKVKLSPERQAPAGGNKNGYADYLIEEEGLNDHNVAVKCADTQSAISEGATSFLFTKYQYVGVFMVAFAILIFLFLGSVEGFSTKSQPCTYSKDKTCKSALANAIFSTVSFLLGAITSVVSGFPGMKIATYANCQDYFGSKEGSHHGEENVSGNETHEKKEDWNVSHGFQSTGRRRVSEHRALFHSAREPFFGSTEDACSSSRPLDAI